VNNQNKYSFGVDVGGTTVKLGLFQANGILQEKWEIKTRTQDAGKHILPDIADTISEKMKEHNLHEEDLHGIGMGIPAPVNSQGVVHATANIGWGYKKVRRELEELTKLKVKVANDANVAALGEMWLGGGQGYCNVVLATLGTGVGGGIIVRSEGIIGEHGSGGEIGHILVEPTEQEKCGCGRQGCLEQYTSATGIVRLAKRRLQEDDTPSMLRDRELSAKEVFDAVKANDQVAIEIARTFGEYLGKAFATISAIVDPAVFVIGGGVSKAGKILLEFIEGPYHKHAFFANQEVKFELAKLGNDAGICGAAKLIIEE
jgi:ROK family protein (putative glucokinase)